MEQIPPGAPNHAPSEKQLTQFSLDNASIAIFWIAKNGGVIYVNKMASQTLGYTHSELLTLFVYDLDPNFSKSSWQAHWQEMKKLGSKIIESTHKTKSGAFLPVEITINHLELDNTEFHCVFVRDISDQKLMEQKLKQSEERFRLTLDATCNGMWDRNFKEDKVFYGSEWAASLGYSEEELEKGTITWQKLLHPDDKEDTLKALRNHFKGRTPVYTAEFRLLNSLGRWQWTLARGKVVERDKDGKAQRFIGVHTNIAERKRAEEQLKTNSEKIRVFAYSVAHDLKNPAIAIHGLAKRLQSKHLLLNSEQIGAYTERILQSTEQIVDLLEKLNTFVSTKETPIVISDINLNEIFEIIRSEFEETLKQKNIIWAPCCHSACIKGDRSSLIRVLRNFIDNAIKYGGHNLSKISIQYEDHLSHHVINVCDDGVGLDPNDASGVFAPFERKSSSRGIRGTGLGLAIVKEVALQHQGSVWTKSIDTGGISFCFSISKEL